MQSIFDLCVPRDEVLQGELREDIFAARLKDVMDGKADPVYGDPSVFFENTFLTTGLKTLLDDALGRLIGKGAGKNAVIRLETAFGGGKTHNLIALYHLASGKTPAHALAGVLDKKLTPPMPGAIKIAGVVGSDLDAANGWDHSEDNIKTFTLWGELAYQLGGRAGFALAKESESLKAAPGTGLFETLIGDKPTLIMLDEIARHLRAAMAIPTASGKSTLSDQTVAFLMSLLEFAASKARCLVVLTLASQTDAFAAETTALRQKLSEALSVSSRQERVLTPAGDNEMPAIVTHRLFKQIDRDAAQTVCAAYAQFYTRLRDKNADLPDRAMRAEYAKEMATAYPFHPELLNTLAIKTSTIPNFSRTRGALRLLAWTVRELWNTQHAGTWVVHPYHLDLANAQIAGDLTSRLDRARFAPVIEADIVSPLIGTQAKAQEVDQPLVASGKPPYARRLATTIFLHSLTQGTASGADPADVMLAVVTPDDSGAGDDPAVLARTLEKLYDKAWFLEYDGHRYRFKTEPSLNKIIADETALVGPSKAKAEIEGRIRQIWKKGFFKPVYFPVEPVDVDDDAELPKLVIVHFEAVNVGAADAEPPSALRKMFEYKGAMESFRLYPNHVLFLIADRDQKENMVGVAQRYLAIGRIVSDAGRMAEFNDEQKKSLKKMYEATELDVRVAITKAYRYLYYPASDAPKTHAYLKRETLPAQEQGDMEKDQSNVVLRVLRALKKAQTADEDPMPALYVKSKAWDQNQVCMTTEELRQAFARKIGLRMLFDVAQVRKTIDNGVKTGVWIYYDANEQFGYDRESPPAAWQIGDHAILYTPAEATRLNIRIKGKWERESPKETKDAKDAKCPVCGMPEDRCVCGAGAQVERGRPAKLIGQGAVAQAFQQIADLCAEHKIARLARVWIKVDGLGKQGASDARALGLAIPQFGKARWSVEQNVTAEFGKGNGAELFEQTFRGGWERFKRIKALTDAFGQEADEFRVTLRVGGEFDGGLPVNAAQFTTLRDVLVALEVGKIVIEATPKDEE